MDLFEKIRKNALTFVTLFSVGFVFTSYLQEIPSILKILKPIDDTYLPDFSYAGYHFGEKQIPISDGKIIKATDYGVVSDDGLDDSKALLKVRAATKNMEGKIVLQFPKGRLIVSEILYLERSDFVLRGTVSGEELTEWELPFICR